jgi:hypothetical protein
MADRNPEEMILKEYKRVTGGRGAAGNTGSGLPGTLRHATATANLKAVVPKQSAAASKPMSLPLPAAPASKASLTTPVGTAPAGTSPAATVAALTGQLSSARQNVTTAGQVNKGYTQPAPVTDAPVASSSGSLAGTIGRTLAKVYGSGGGLISLFSSLFGSSSGSGSAATATAAVKYAMPRSIQIEAANSRGGKALPSADYGQGGTPRAYGPVTSDASAGWGQGPAAPGPTTAPATQTAAAGAQIVVNVQAMDSRSFLDHSGDIAQAVREAMLNMHSLNDVVSEL